MGGMLHMAVREPAGQVSTVAIHTGFLLRGLQAASFLAGDFSRWKAQFPVELSAPLVPLAPHWYGLVAIDFVQQQILHLQGFCALDADHVAEWMLCGPEEIAALRERIALGAYRTLRLPATQPRHVELDLEASTYGATGAMQRLVFLAESVLGGEWRTQEPQFAGRPGECTVGWLAERLGVPGDQPHAATVIHLAQTQLPYQTAWTYRYFNDMDPRGCLDLRDALLAAGFVLGEQDEHAWAAYLQKRLEGADLVAALRRLGWRVDEKEQLCRIQ